MSIIFYVIAGFLVGHLWSGIEAVTYSDTHDYDSYGVRLASNSYFVLVAQNDANRFLLSVAPFGRLYTCEYPYVSTADYVISVAAGQAQNSTHFSFVVVRTNSTAGDYQTLTIFTVARTTVMGDGNLPISTCASPMAAKPTIRDVMVWKRLPSEMTTLQVDPTGKFAYGFVTQGIFILDIDRQTVVELSWTGVLPLTKFEPRAMDTGRTADGLPMTILTGYYQSDGDKALVAVALIRLNPPGGMTLMHSFSLQPNTQLFIRARDAFNYEFDSVMSVAIQHFGQKALICVPKLQRIYLFSFNSSYLTLIQEFAQTARSAVWLDTSGVRMASLLSHVPTLPWAQSRVLMSNVTSGKTLYVYPNNQQKFDQWSTTIPTFIRMAQTYDDQLVLLASDGTVVLVRTSEPGYYAATASINSLQKSPATCPRGTYKDSRGPWPCIVCPTNTRSLFANASTNSTPTLNCVACSSDSFCPLGSISEVNQSSISSTSQAYAYPPSPASTSFDDILIVNTFNLQFSSGRCLVISPFFWSLIVLLIAAIFLVLMAVFYHHEKGMKHFKRLECLFRHSDLIGNGELWFGGLISFSMIVLIIYGYWFGALFVTRYPVETSPDANFVCDTSLRNTKFSSALQLLATIKSDEESPIFDLLDQQKITLTATFVQTDYTCDNVSAQESFGSYLVDFSPGNCTLQSDQATLIVSYVLPKQKLSLQINLTGSSYIGGVTICLTGPVTTTTNSSLYVVQELNFCQVFSSSDQTLPENLAVNFALTKVINRTELLDYSSLSNFSGIWIPTTTHSSLNDALKYEQQGAFLRYLSTEHILLITLSETQFYVINKQEPIARTSEILFHNLLFTTTLIGIFALVFLIFKLTFMPLIQWIVARKMCCKRLYKPRAVPTNMVRRGMGIRYRF